MDSNGYNASIYPTGYCYLCGNGGDVIRHEIFGGPFRRKSKAFGLWLNLCPNCHTDVHANPAKYAWLKADAQVRTMEASNWTEADFIAAFGKNYLGG